MPSRSAVSNVFCPTYPVKPSCRAANHDELVLGTLRTLRYTRREVRPFREALIWAICSSVAG